MCPKCKKDGKRAQREDFGGVAEVTWFFKLRREDREVTLSQCTVSPRWSVEGRCWSPLSGEWWQDTWKWCEAAWGCSNRMLGKGSSHSMVGLWNWISREVVSTETVRVQGPHGPKLYNFSFRRSCKEQGVGLIFFRVLFCFDFKSVCLVFWIHWSYFLQIHLPKLWEKQGMVRGIHSTLKKVTFWGHVQKKKSEDETLKAVHKMFYT